MSEFDYTGKVAIITGAGAGLGREYALSLAARGASVLVNDYGCGPDGSAGIGSPANDVVAEIREKGGTAVANGSSVVDGAQVVEAAMDAFGRIDILVNNAGIAGGGWFSAIPVEDFDRMLETHLGGTIAVTRAAWPHLARQGWARIINSSSTASYGAPFTSHYATAKSAMIGFTRSLAIEGAPDGICVNAIMPSAFTRLTSQIPDPMLLDYMSRNFRPQRVAAFVLWLLSTSHNGEIFSVAGGRAARVVLAQGEGGQVQDDTPEAWAKVEAQVMAVNPPRAAMSMFEELCDQLEDFGGDALPVAAGIRKTHEWGKQNA